MRQFVQDSAAPGTRGEPLHGCAVWVKATTAGASLDSPKLVRGFPDAKACAARRGLP
jgi:hypothetical protein